ncbi:ATP-binding cassette domain-containing protein [Camelimonas abortus]
MLTLSGLSKVYAGGAAALANVSLTVAGGEIAAIVGGSGCGKTTLLRLIAGLDEASAGAIEIDGDRISGRPHSAIGIVFQEPRLLPWLSVRDNVAFGLAGLPRGERRARAGTASAAGRTRPSASSSRSRGCCPG